MSAVAAWLFAPWQRSTKRLFRGWGGADLLHVDVEQGVGMVVFVAVDRFTGGAVNVRRAVEMTGGQDAVDR
ncbi:hypothetical protein OS128_07870 [Corynebacterium sp. P5848]|nr:hypothetical protein [Corynebacterium marambiense]MCX7542829.1 hypothetical protein [Corynebacterium marambiense]